MGISYNTKETQYCSDDLKVNRGIVVKMKTFNGMKPNVVEIAFSFYAVPQISNTDDGYAKSIALLKKKINKICKRYVCDNGNTFGSKSIVDCSFTSANLKKGYNKYVTVSLYVKQLNQLNLARIQNRIKNTIKSYSFEITSAFQEEKFSCYKTKHN